MSATSFCCIFAAVFVVSFAFAFKEAPAGEERPRFARDALEGGNRKPFAFAFAKRANNEETDNFFLPRFARDADEKSKFAFAFAKRAEEGRRFTRDLPGDEEPNWRFAKRGGGADYDLAARFAKFA